MTTQPIPQTDIQFKIGLWTLVLLSVATTINSFVRIFLEPIPEFVIGWVAASLFSTLILLIPFRKGERWAWYATWIFVALLGGVFSLGAEVGIFYLAAAIIVSLGLLLTRAWMVLLALEFGDFPRFTWVNTFVVILLSAAMMGGIWGGAQYARQTGGSKRWRWAALAPLMMVIYPLLFMEGFIPTLLSTGEGGGAISVALAGIFGGYALAGGRRWLRLVTGFLFLATVLGNVFAFHLNSIFDGLSPTASRTFAALYFTQLMLLLAFGSSIPFKIRGAPET